VENSRSTVGENRIRAS